MAKSLPMTDTIRKRLREGLRKPVKSNAKCAMVEHTSASTPGSGGIIAWTLVVVCHTLSSLLVGVPCKNAVSRGIKAMKHMSTVGR